MKTIMTTCRHLADLFYPKSCICCDEPLIDQEDIICLSCRFDLAFVDNETYRSNLVMRVFEGRIPIEKGASFLQYHEIGKTKQLIHELKYRNCQSVGTFLAQWFGKQLKKSKEFQDMDCIIPVPLHQKKLKKRGYNQLTKFGRGLEEILGIPYEEHLLRRISFTKTQTQKKRLDRFQNTNSRFVVEQPELLNNKHVLLIDDVITTGATLEACCKELLRSENIKISIVTMAITE
jgi:ComF family protein